MNFKLSKWKVIGSIIITVLYGLYKILTYRVGMFCDPTPCKFDFLFGVGWTFSNVWNIITILIVLIAVYVIWSLVEKKKVKGEVRLKKKKF
jgi:hypothetical protein